MKSKELQDLIFEEASKVVVKELVGLCSLSNPSILRDSSKDNLQSIKWESINSELMQRCPRFHQLMSASISNPSHSRNVHKKGDALIPPMCDAACQLISIFCEDMNACRRIKSIILKKGGLKKVGFKRLSPTYNCMGYNSTIKMFENFGKHFDQKLHFWKEQVELGVKEEKKLIESLKETTEESIEKAQEALRKHRENMHPGYTFTADNVDMRCEPRQMTLKNKNKDHHMFNIVAFKNRVNPNHLPDVEPKNDINKEPFTTFLPSAEEQGELINEFVVLIGHKWATAIPALFWFKEHLPETIVHDHMEETKQKTEKV